MVKELDINRKKIQYFQKSKSPKDGVSWKSILNFFRLIIAFCLIASLLACSASQTVNVSAKKEIQQVFTNRNPRILSHFRDLELEVRMKTTAALPKENYKEYLECFPTGGGYTGFGVWGAPATGNIAAGGIILMSLGGVAYIYEKGIWDSIKDALINYEFTRTINKAMKDCLNITFAKERVPNVKIDVIIQSFGLVGEWPHNSHCLIVSADFVISRGGMEVKRDHVEISNGNRSKDAPPPQCAHLKRFAKNKAKLVKDTLTDYAEVLALMAIDRIQKGSSK